MAGADINASNWPDPARPGVVMWPDKDGRHLFALGGGYIAAFWRSDKQWLVCDDDHDLGFCASESVKDLHYICPVLTPAQIAEMLAAERERCAKVCEDTYEKSGRDFEYLGCNDAAEQIRNLGAEP